MSENIEQLRTMCKNFRSQDWSAGSIVTGQDFLFGLLREIDALATRPATKQADDVSRERIVSGLKDLALQQIASNMPRPLVVDDGGTAYFIATMSEAMKSAGFSKSHVDKLCGLACATIAEAKADDVCPECSRGIHMHKCTQEHYWIPKAPSTHEQREG